jgi:hypothetical protein
MGTKKSVFIGVLILSLTLTSFNLTYGFKDSNIDGLVKSQKVAFSVIPAKAGIQLFQGVLDPGFRRGDDQKDFLRDHQYWDHL